MCRDGDNYYPQRFSHVNRVADNKRLVGIPPHWRASQSLIVHQAIFASKNAVANPLDDRVMMKSDSD